MGSRRRVSLAIAVAVLASGAVILPPAVPPSLGQFSEACPGKTGEHLPEGEFEGPFSWQAKGTGDINIDVVASGRVKVTVGEDGRVADASADLEMTISGGGAFGTTLDGEGSGHLELAEGGFRDFSVKGPISGSGSFGTSLKTFSGSGSDEVKLGFAIRETVCRFGRGNLVSPMFSQILQGFHKAGLSVEAPLSWNTWQVAATGTRAERYERLQKQLDDIAAQVESDDCGGLACGRVVPQRLKRLIAESKSGSKTETACLLEIIQGGIRRIYGRFIDNGIGELNKSRQHLHQVLKNGRGINLQHEFELLKGKVKPLLEYSRQLAEMGVEGCNGDFLNSIARALGDVSKELIRAAQKQRETLLLMQISQQVALLGATAEAAESIGGELLSIATTGAKEAYGYLRRLKRRDPCDDARLTAFKDLKFWAAQSAVLGNSDWLGEVALLAPKFAECGA